MLRRPTVSTRSDTLLPSTTPVRLTRHSATPARRGCRDPGSPPATARSPAWRCARSCPTTPTTSRPGWRRAAQQRATRDQPARQPRRQAPPREDRSEEHTSELQSLMRMSNAGLCLKKKINTAHEVHHSVKDSTNDYKRNIKSNDTYSR